VGINSGEVVVAFVDVDYSLELSAAGAPVHLASRIEALCRPGAVYIGEATYQLASEFVEAHSLGKISIRGIEEKVDCLSGSHLLSIGPRSCRRPTVWSNKQRAAEAKL
jgi:class 3 adenylate cyclase